MIRIFQVSKNIWCIRRPSYLTCSYAVSTQAGIVFIDAGMSRKGADVIHALKRLNKGQDAVLGSILTHWHNDHSSGADFVEKVCGKPVYCHPNEGKKLTLVSKNSLLSKVSDAIPEVGPLVLLKGLLKEGPAIQLKSFENVRDRQTVFDQFEIIETPGHTPGHISVFDHENQTLFAGDALAVVNGKIRRMARAVTEDLKTAEESIRKLLSFPTKILCPGHRAPLLDSEFAFATFKNDLDLQKRWPIFG